MICAKWTSKYRFQANEINRAASGPDTKLYQVRILSSSHRFESLLSIFLQQDALRTLARLEQELEAERKRRSVAESAAKSAREQAEQIQKQVHYKFPLFTLCYFNWIFLQLLDAQTTRDAALKQLQEEYVKRIAAEDIAATLQQTKDEVI